MTEAFVHLLDHLTESSPRSFAALVTNLSDGVITPNEDTAPDFHVVSQISTDEGAPDIEISGPDSYVLVEVKRSSKLNSLQSFLSTKLPRVYRDTEAAAKSTGWTSMPTVIPVPSHR